MVCLCRPLEKKWHVGILSTQVIMLRGRAFGRWLPIERSPERSLKKSVSDVQKRACTNSWLFYPHLGVSGSKTAGCVFVLVKSILVFTYYNCLLLQSKESHTAHCVSLSFALFLLFFVHQFSQPAMPETLHSSSIPVLICPWTMPCYQYYLSFSSSRPNSSF